MNEEEQNEVDNNMNEEQENEVDNIMNEELENVEEGNQLQSPRRSRKRSRNNVFIVTPTRKKKKL